MSGSLVRLPRHSGGTPWFRAKSSRVSLDELKAISAGADCVVVATGFEEQAVVDDPKSLAVPVETLKGAEAYARFRDLRRAGKAVALIAHTR